MELLGPTKKQLGERSQAHIIARLLEVGYAVLTPNGNSSRYDLVIEDAKGTGYVSFFSPGIYNTHGFSC